MKKVLSFIVFICFVCFLYFYFIYNQNDLKKLLKDVNSNYFYINKYSVFGTDLIMNACIDNKLNEPKVVLKNKKEEIVLSSNFYEDNNRTCFNFSKYLNEGLNLDELNKGNYLLLVKDNNQYYSLKKEIDYKNIEYYTITKNNKNNKININLDEYKSVNYVEFIINEKKLPQNVYDIVIDAGHGGKDTGSNYKLNGKTYYESNITLNISLLLKKELENLGLKVKLTRDSDTYLDPYGSGGRAILPNEYNSKYSISIHLNSVSDKMNYGGVEVYIPNDIDYEFATILADNLSNVVGYSKKKTYKIKNGVYFTYFTKEDIKDSSDEMIDKDMKPYDIVENSPYMYMIREVGGIHTNAYIDGRNEYYGLNKYYNSNKTAEPYLIELGYINYESDLKKLINSPELFSQAISDSFDEYLKIS